MTSVRLQRWADMDAAARSALLERGQLDLEAVMPACREIVNGVRDRGDAALLEFTRRFDKVDLATLGLRVSDQEFDAADRQIDDALRDALERMLTNIRCFHATQRPEGLALVEVEPGVWCGDRWTPLDAVCLYVPRGRGAFSSVACMLGVPAKIAEVPRIIVCTPPGSDGQVDAATLVACRKMGIHEVYRVGGGQAVAAVAYGTPTLPRCDRIVGPGNVYVSAARQLLATVLDPGPPAGPSEALILADGAANPSNVAWNLMIEAEHGENSTALLVTPDENLARAAIEAVAAHRQHLTPQRALYVDTVLAKRGGVLLVTDLDEAIAVANSFAPEHLALMVTDPWAVMPRLRHAGEILMGDYPIISLGNYVMGVNAILPTGGRARVASCVSVSDFLKRSSVGFVTAGGFSRLKETVPVMSRDEGFSAHHEAVLRWQSK